MGRFVATVVCALFCAVTTSASAQIPTYTPPDTALAYGPGPRRYSSPPPRQTYYAPGYYDLRHGALVMVYAGLNMPVGAGTDSYSSGFNLGGIVGGHLNRDVSLNGELSVSFLNYDYASTFETRYMADLTFSPLFHFGQGTMEFAVGPKLGFYSFHLGYDDGYVAYEDYSAQGLVFGVNAALLFQVGRSLSIGGLLSIYGHHATSECYVFANGDEVCGDATYKQPNLATLNFALRW